MSSKNPMENSSNEEPFDDISDYSLPSSGNITHKSINNIRIPPLTPITPLTPATPSTPDDESYDVSDVESSHYEIASGLPIEDENKILHERVTMLKTKLKLLENEQKIVLVKGGLFKKSGKKIIAQKWKKAYSENQNKLLETQKELLTLQSDMKDLTKKSNDNESKLKKAEMKNKFFESEMERLREKLKEIQNPNLKEKQQLKQEIISLKEINSKLENDLNLQNQSSEDNKTIINELKKQIESYKMQSKQTSDQNSMILEKEMERIKSQHKIELLTLKKENSLLQDKLNQQNSQFGLKDFSESNNVTEETQKNLKDLKINLLENKLTSQTEDFEKERNQLLEEISSKEKQIQDFNNKLKSQQKLSDQLRTNENAIQNIENLLENEKKLSANLLIEKNTWIEERKSLIQERDRILLEYNNISKLPIGERDQRKKIKELQDELGLQERMLIISKDLEQQQTQRIESLENRTVELENEKNALDKRLLELESLNKERLNSLSSDLSTQSSNALRYQQMKMEMEIQVVDMNRINKSLNRQLEELQIESNEVINSLKQKIERLGEELHSYKKIELALDESNSLVDKLKRQLDEKIIQLKDIERLESNISHLNETIKSYEEEQKISKSKVRRLEEENYTLNSQILVLRNSINEKTSYFEGELLKRASEFSDLQFKYEQLADEKENEVKAKVKLIDALNEVGNTTLNNSFSKLQGDQFSSTFTPIRSPWQENSILSPNKFGLSPQNQATQNAENIKNVNLKVGNQVLEMSVQRLKTENKKLKEDLQQSISDLEEIKKISEQKQKKLDEEKLSEEDYLNTIEHLKQKINNQRDEYDELLKFTRCNVNEEKIEEWSTKILNDSKQDWNFSRFKSSHDQLFLSQLAKEDDLLRRNSFQRFPVSPISKHSNSTSNNLSVLNTIQMNDPLLTSNSHQNIQTINTQQSQGPRTPSATNFASMANITPLSNHISNHLSSPLGKSTSNIPRERLSIPSNESPLFQATPSRYNSTAGMKRY